MKFLFALCLALYSTNALAWSWSKEEMGWMDIERYCGRGLYDADYYIKKKGVREQSNELKADVAVISKKLNDLVTACDQWTKVGPNANCNTCKNLDELKRELNDSATLFESYRVKVSHFDGELGAFRDFVAGLGMKDCLKALGKKDVKSSIDYLAWKERNIRVFNVAFKRCEQYMAR